MPAPKLTKASVANALAAAAGLTPSAMTVQADGSIRLEFLSGELNTAANEATEPAAIKPKKWGQKR